MDHAIPGRTTATRNDFKGGSLNAQALRQEIGCASRMPVNRHADAMARRSPCREHNRRIRWKGRDGLRRIGTSLVRALRQAQRAVRGVVADADFEIRIAAGSFSELGRARGSAQAVLRPERIVGLIRVLAAAASLQALLHDAAGVDQLGLERAGDSEEREKGNPEHGLRLPAAPSLGKLHIDPSEESSAAYAGCRDRCTVLAFRGARRIGRNPTARSRTGD